jgi:hypothetical protein
MNDVCGALGITNSGESMAHVIKLLSLDELAGCLTMRPQARQTLF